MRVLGVRREAKKYRKLLIFKSLRYYQLLPPYYWTFYFRKDPTGFLKATLLTLEALPPPKKAVVKLERFVQLYYPENSGW
jgi:hypothetical protein